MANLALAFNLSASATGMAQGINAGVVELQKLGYAAKQTASDVSTLKTIEISKLFISGISSLASTFQGFTAGAAQSIDKTRQLAQSLGVSYAALRNLQIAADLGGASSEQLASAFTRAQVVISNASRGSKDAIAALNRLGLSVSDLATQTTTQQFSSIAAAINAIANPAERSAAAVAIFGKSGASLLPTFRELPQNLLTAKQLLGGFRDTLSATNPDAIDAINDAFQSASVVLGELAGRLLTQLAPSLTSAASEFVRFAQQIDIGAAASVAGATIDGLVSVLKGLVSVSGPLATSLLPAIGGYLAFINRQAISQAILGLAGAFRGAATAAAAYSGGAAAAAAATYTLRTAITALLSATGIGLLVTLLGTAGGLALQWATANEQAATNSTQAIDGTTQAAKKFTAQIQAAIGGTEQFGQKIKDALKVPESITAREFAEGAIGEARSAIISLGKELGGLNKVPQPLIAEFEELLKYSRQIADRKPNGVDFVSAAQGANTLTEAVKRLADVRKTDAERIKEASEAAKKANEEAKKRVDELRTSTLTDAEKSRLTLNQDLQAIATNIAAIEKEAAQARQRFDISSLVAAEERLASAKKEAATLTAAAKQQDRDRRVQARGIDLNLLKPVKTIGDEIKAVRDAFNSRDIDKTQYVQGLRNLAAEGIKIRQDIADELARPAQRALNVADIRTTEGMAAILGYQRQDPAIEQRRAQLQKLEEIRGALIRLQIDPVEILGG